MTYESVVFTLKNIKDSDFLETKKKVVNFSHFVSVTIEIHIIRYEKYYDYTAGILLHSTMYYIDKCWKSLPRNPYRCLHYLKKTKIVTMIDFKYPNRIMKHPVLKNINEMLDENA